MLHMRGSAEAWSQVRIKFPQTLLLRAEQVIE
jgi:hypothetical protein